MNERTKPIAAELSHPTCTCRGLRYCAFCLSTDRVIKRRGNVKAVFSDYKCMIYEVGDGKAHSTTDSGLIASSSIEEVAQLLGPTHQCSENCFFMSGVFLCRDFLSENDAQFLLSRIDSNKWLPSQSGRRKQDYGPRVNFKFKRVNFDKFAGLPDYIELLLQRVKEIDEVDAVLGDFMPVELCNLEYADERLSSIDLHKDDTWIWGERLVSISLSADCVLTLEHPETKTLVFLPLPTRSLLVLSGEQRFLWNHGILPNHISGRRVVITLRELSLPFLEEQHLYEKFGKEIQRKASYRIS